MPRLDWYAFYVADYRADTRHLSPMQHFAYRELIDEIFLSGQHEDPPSVPDDEGYLLAICRPGTPSEWEETRHVLIDGPRALLRSDGGRLTQKRVSHEVAKAVARTRKAKTAADGRWAHPRPENAPQVTPAPKNGNGNGHMSDRQYLFFASRIGKWQTENAWKWVGASDASDFERAFATEFGLPWSKWKAEQDYRAEADA